MKYITRSTIMIKRLIKKSEEVIISPDMIVKNIVLKNEINSSFLLLNLQHNTP